MDRQSTLTPDPAELMPADVNSGANPANIEVIGVGITPESSCSGFGRGR
jgi:hypothetical protein